MVLCIITALLCTHPEEGGMTGGRQIQQTNRCVVVTLRTDAPGVVALGGGDIGQPQDAICVNEGREQMCKAKVGQIVIITKRL